MEPSIPSLPRAARRRLMRVVHKTRDKDHARRALAILQLAEGLAVSEVARQLCAARSTVYRWWGRFETEGERGLESTPPGRTPWTLTPAVAERLGELLRERPRVFGYLRSRWTSQMLAREITVQLGVLIHSSTVRRWLPRLGFRWRRARPTLCKRDPAKAEKLTAIAQALARASGREPVFYVDEADVDLNPRIGAAWMRRGKQTAIPTPGTNQKRYLAGALDARTGAVLWTEAPSKGSELFLSLLRELRGTYRSARRIVLIVDNYVIHRSQATRRWLEQNPKFELLFQPVYHPWVNRIERLWKQLHENITRNHCYPKLESLMQAVRTFLHVVQPFPGSAPALAKV